MNANCLNERDLILLHYGETPDGTTCAAATAHLSGCPACRMRLEQLATELNRIPTVPADPDPVAATRVAARVNERLQQRHRWLPVAGAAAAGVVAMAMAVMVFLPANQPLAPSPQIASSEQLFVGPPRPVIRQATLDLDLLEQLELLEEFETLRDIEGV